MALFKIYNNINSNNPLPAEHHKGYMYFDATTNRFYIDVEDDPKDSNGNPILNVDDGIRRRVCLNAWISHYAIHDDEENVISSTYLKKSDMHILTFGAGGAFTMLAKELLSWKRRDKRLIPKSHNESFFFILLYHIFLKKSSKSFLSSCWAKIIKLNYLLFKIYVRII